MSPTILAAIFVCTFLAVWGALCFIFSGKGWSVTDGVILISRIDEERHSPVSKRAETRLMNFHYAVEYDYTVGGRSYRGDRMLPVLPTIYGRLAEAEAMQAQFPVGKKVPVYFRPADPGTACLMPDAALNAAGTAVIAFLVAIAATAVAAAVLWMRIKDAEAID